VRFGPGGWPVVRLREQQIWRHKHPWVDFPWHRPRGQNQAARLVHTQVHVAHYSSRSAMFQARQGAPGHNCSLFPAFVVVSVANQPFPTAGDAEKISHATSGETCLSGR